MQKKIKINKSITDKLLKLPETGMGYQKVILYLHNGEILFDRIILNSEYLILKDNEVLDSDDIFNVELE